MRKLAQEAICENAGIWHNEMRIGLAEGSVLCETDAPDCAPGVNSFIWKEKRRRPDTEAPYC